MINEKYITVIREKTARMQALEAQVNPHFLYNALQAIASHAILTGRKDISRMIEILARTLRYSIKEGGLVRISMEMEYVNNYLLLQKMRFEDRLSIKIEMDDRTANVMIPKISIYTLVENSILHGLEQMTNPIHIHILTAIEEDHLVIQVEDDGPGIDSKKLQQILAGLDDPHWLDKPNESIGLKNLYSRLNLMYDNHANMYINSNQAGTCIRLILPYVKEDGKVCTEH